MTRWSLDRLAQRALAHLPLRFQEGRWPFAVHLGLLVGLLYVSYGAWLSGGIFSPRMAWMAVMPLLAFYALSRWAGLGWLVLVLGVEVAMSYITWQRGGADDPALGAAHIVASFASYSVVTCILITVPYLYDALFRKAYNESLQRNLALEEKRQELVRTAALREQFIATVNHELRTPMNAILGFNNMLLARVADNPQALKILNHTRQSADHLLTILNDVLDDAQRQAGNINLHTETFALRDTINTAFELFAQRVQSRHVQYTCVIDDDVPLWVSTDRHRLMQILVNLLGNAIKFTHQGQITLAVRDAPAGGVHFSVRDSGIGIPLAQQPNLFQRFVQGQDDTQSRYGGNGLGLSITQRLVERMGGRIGFESQPGVGSLFWFTLPLVEVAPPPIETLQTHHGEEVNTHVVQRFLVVDDHPINRLLVRQILRNHWKNCHIVEADNGLQALDVLRQQDVDVIFMDMVMPKMDGIEATSTLRLTFDQPARDTPVLGLTANVNSLDLERFAAAGVSAVLIKPFDPAKVCAQVEEMLIKKRSSLGS